MLDVDLTEERQNEILTRARALVEKDGGVWVGQESWGRRKLAYEIDKKTDAVYYLLHFDSEPATLDELTRILKITDGAMRHMAVRRLPSATRTATTSSAPPPDAEALPEPEPEAAPAPAEETAAVAEPVAEAEAEPAPEPEKAPE